jgi:hypothetical protein
VIQINGFKVISFRRAGKELVAQTNLITITGKH